MALRCVIWTTQENRLTCVVYAIIFNRVIVISDRYQRVVLGAREYDRDRHPNDESNTFVGN